MTRTKKSFQENTKLTTMQDNAAATSLSPSKNTRSRSQSRQNCDMTKGDETTDPPHASKTDKEKDKNTDATVVPTAETAKEKTSTPTTTAAIAEPSRNSNETNITKTTTNKATSSKAAVEGTNDVNDNDPTKTPPKTNSTKKAPANPKKDKKNKRKAEVEATGKAAKKGVAKAKAKGNLKNDKADDSDDSELLYDMGAVEVANDGKDALGKEVTEKQAMAFRKIQPLKTKNVKKYRDKVELIMTELPGCRPNGTNLCFVNTNLEADESGMYKTTGTKMPKTERVKCEWASGIEWKPHEEYDPDNTEVHVFDPTKLNKIACQYCLNHRPDEYMPGYTINSYGAHLNQCPALSTKEKGQKNLSKKEVQLVKCLRDTKKVKQAQMTLEQLKQMQKERAEKEQEMWMEMNSGKF